MSGPIPEDLERRSLALEDAPAVTVGPRKEPKTPREWIKDNLFSTPFSSILTVVAGAFAAFVLFRIVQLLFFTGQWEVFKVNLRLYMVGRFPMDEMWRVWASVFFLVVIAGLSYGMSPMRGPRTPQRSAGLAVVGAFGVYVLLYLIDTGLVLALTFGSVALAVVSVFVGRAAGPALRRPLMIAWVLAFPTVIILLRAFDGVSPRLWGGFLLNLVVAVVGIFVSFPIGILLALGRRSTLPVIRLFCVGFIEIVRGAPLYTWFLFGEFVLPLMLPTVSIPRIIRAMTMITIFSSAYVAEIVRGGLQGVHFGQYEAARALGLSTTRMTALVVLPQALKATIPAMIGHFISLYKDTSLLAVIGGASDMLRAARRATAAPQFSADQMEALLPAAFIFFILAFAMSRWSQRLERRLGVGVR